MTTASSEVAALPRPVTAALDGLVEAARAALGESLSSIVLYGSAAEGRVRATSDINLILVLSRFEQTAIDRLREPLRAAQAAVGLTAMLVLETEIPEAAEAFAAKFADIGRRRRVLYGRDPFAALQVPRPATIARLRQVLLNLVLRLRAAYALRSLREEQLALVVADAAGPLRSAAASLLELEGETPGSPRASLQRVAATLAPDGFTEALARLSEAREQGLLPPGVAGPTLFRLLELAGALRARLAALR